MTDSVLTLLVVLITILTIVTGIWLGMLIIVLFSVKKTLDRLQKAIDTVEDTALRSLSPFLSLKALFSDSHGFLRAAGAAFKSLRGKKSR